MRQLLYIISETINTLFAVARPIRNIFWGYSLGALYSSSSV